MAALTIVVLRHGATEWSRTGRHTSRTDLELEPAGREAATRAAPLIAALGPYDAVYASPLRRAQETARLAGLTGWRVDDGLREWDYGDDEGLTTPEIRESHPGWSTVWEDGTHGGETVAELSARVDGLLERVRASGAERVAFAAHGHLLRVCAARWIGAPAELAQHLLLEAGHVGVLDDDRGTPALGAWNVDAGLLAG